MNMMTFLRLFRLLYIANTPPTPIYATVMIVPYSKSLNFTSIFTRYNNNNNNNVSMQSPSWAPLPPQPPRKTFSRSSMFRDTVAKTLDAFRLLVF